MHQFIAKIFQDQELKVKIYFTIIMLAIFRVGSQIPTPGIHPNILMEIFGESSQQGFLALLNLFSGGAMGRFSIFSLGIMPYISASIIMQLMKIVLPSIEALSKEGGYGEQKIQLYTKYLTLFLCIIQAFGLLVLLKNQVLSRNHPLVDQVLGAEGLSWFFIFNFILTISTGTMLLFWMGEKITEHGIGNGISLIIFSGIVSRLPQSMLQLYHNLQNEPGSLIVLFIVLLIFIGVMGFVVVEQKAIRKVPIQYTKRIIGNRMYSSQSTYIPFKLNPSGVLPIIFASSIILFPAQLIGLFGNLSPVLLNIANSLSPGHVVYMCLYLFLVVFFAYFYTAIYFNPVEIANRLKKEGAFVPGIRPGSNTANYLGKILNRITFPGALFLGFVAIFPDIVLNIFSNISIPQSFAYSMGGTSLLIMVGVSLETLRQLDSHLTSQKSLPLFSGHFSK